MNNKQSKATDGENGRQANESVRQNDTRVNTKYFTEAIEKCHPDKIQKGLEFSKKPISLLKENRIDLIKKLELLKQELSELNQQDRSTQQENIEAKIIELMSVSKKEICIWITTK